MIQGSFLKDGEVVEFVTDGKGEIKPEKELQSFTFPRREIETIENIETYTPSELLTLALAAGGTLAALILVIALLDFSPIGRVFFAGMIILDGVMLIKNLTREVEL